MHPKRILFLGSKPIGYECLKYLIAQKEALNLEITGLLTRTRKEFGAGHDLALLATENNIPLLNDLDELPACDIIYSVQYHQLLKEEHIARASEIAVNLHMAPLPEYRGANQFSFAILDNRKEFGATIHQIDSHIDHGDILFQKRFSIPDECWVNELYDLTYEASIKLFRQTLSHLVKGIYNGVPQDALKATHGSNLHYRNEMEALKLINLQWDSEKIERHIRAVSMPGFEGPYCFINGKKVHFVR